MSITSQQLESWIPCEDITPLDINDLETIDLSGLNSMDFSSLTTSSISTFTVNTTGLNYTIPSISALTTADIITLTGPGGSGGTGSSMYTWNGGSGGSATYSGTSYTFKMPEEWVDCFPDFNRIKKMCEDYPGLKIAYEKFVTTYEMVKVDYDNPENKK